MPLVIPPAFLERLLVEQVFTEPDTHARIVNAADSCNEIVLSQPALRPLGGRIFVTAHGRARAGFTLFGACYQPFDWEGQLEAEEEPRIAPGGQAVEFRVVNSWLEDESDWLTVPALWDWVKPEVHPRLETLRVDLAPLLEELRRALPLFATQRDLPAVARLSESLALGDARVEERGLVLRLRFDVEVGAAAAPPSAAPEPALTPDELAAFETTLREWDAFLTFVIKAAGRDALDPALRATLLAVLLDARHEILAALAEPGRDGEDRVRVLFTSSWAAAPARARLALGRQRGPALPRLRGVGRRADRARRRGPRVRLRDLARRAAPPRAHPRARGERGSAALERGRGPGAARDLRLRRGAARAAAAAGATAEPAPDAAPEPEAAPGAALRLLDWLFPAAFAAPEPPPKPGPYSSPLDGHAPRIADLDTYLPEIAALLREASAEVFAHGKLGAEHRELFEQMVLATAWQESCWRQYVRRRGAVAPLRSSVGALGLMQVNPHVWRGFYAVDGLSWSIGYNARAGSEILLHYLRDYAIERGEEQAGGPDALARASYAVYHGGPSHLRRYRQPKKWRPALVAVDRAFHDKLREVAAGRELGVRECFAG